jgi:hypothetical protein
MKDHITNVGRWPSDSKESYFKQDWRKGLARIPLRDHLTIPSKRNSAKAFARPFGTFRLKKGLLFSPWHRYLKLNLVRECLFERFFYFVDKLDGFLLSLTLDLMEETVVVINWVIGDLSRSKFQRNINLPRTHHTFIWKISATVCLKVQSDRKMTNVICPQANR